MPRLYDFLGRLRDNNNREWFKANKTEYDELRALWLADIDVMLAHILFQRRGIGTPQTAVEAAFVPVRATRRPQL